MLGDAGANALRRHARHFAATTLPRGARLGALAVVLGLTAASEKVSFTKVIERTGPLRRVDMLGRRPAPVPAETAPAETALAESAPTGAAPDPRSAEAR